MQHGARSLILVLSLVAAATACSESPTEFCEQNPDDLSCDDTVVGETEIWKLELEQLGDGSTSRYPQRGTITMRLRLNRTAQRDPTCNEEFSENLVTTFLADVEAVSSRLQAPATGSADGSWNCHGFVATVRLNDGTRYDLRIDGAFGRGMLHRFFDFPGTAWQAADRSGQFSFRSLGRVDEAPPSFDRIRESHVGLVVRNRSNHEWDVFVEYPARIENPVRVDYFAPGSGPRGSSIWETVTPGAEIRFSVPAHPTRRHIAPPVPAQDPVLWLIDLAAFRDLPLDEYWARNSVQCFLAPDHDDVLELLVHGDRLECGFGWVVGPYLEASRSPIFIHAGSQTLQGTVAIVTNGLVHEVEVETTGTGVTAWFLDILPGQDPLLTVTVAPGTSRGEHPIRVIGRSTRGASSGQADTAFIPLYVYDLDVTTEADTLSIAAGASDTTSVLIDGEGYFSDVRFRATDLPDVLQSEPSFSPSRTNRFQGVASLITVPVDAAADPGTYGLTICATIVEDPRERCHATPLEIVVLPAGAIVGIVAVDGEGIPGVQVDITGPEDRSDVSNAFGQFFFFNLPDGEYVVTISGYPTSVTFPYTSLTVTVQGGEVIAAFTGSGS